MSCLEMRNHYSDFPACLAGTVPATSKPSKGKKLSSLGCTALHKVHSITLISFVLKDDVTHILLNAHQKIGKKLGTEKTKSVISFRWQLFYSLVCSGCHWCCSKGLLIYQSQLRTRQVYVKKCKKHPFLNFFCHSYSLKSTAFICYAIF